MLLSTGVIVPEIRVGRELELHGRETRLCCKHVVYCYVHVILYNVVSCIVHVLHVQVNVCCVYK